MCAKEHGYEANFLQNAQDVNTTLRKSNPPNIFMIHRVLYDYNQAILPLYFDRKNPCLCLCHLLEKGHMKTRK